MTEDEKKKYKALAHKYNSNNSNCNKEQPLNYISDVQKNSCDFWNMQKQITNMFKYIPNDQGKNYYIELGPSSINFN